MKPTKHLIAALALALSLGACGAGDDGGDDDVTADGGPGDAGGGGDAGPMGNTALGTYNRALPVATGWQADATLFTVHGEVIDGVTGENVVDSNQSFWKITFVSESSGLANDIMSYMGALSTYERPAPDGATLITKPWDDSPVILAKLAENGFVPPALDDPAWELAVDLGIFPLFDGYSEPIWKVSKSNLISVGDSELWIITYSPADGGYILCPPNSDQCSLVP